MSQRGSILTEDVIFLVLNLLFLSMIILFISTNLSPTAKLEEATAKKIALFIDAAQPGMTLTVNVDEALLRAKKNGISPTEAIMLSGNSVLVRLDSSNNRQGYTYSFFTRAPVSVFSAREGYITLVISSEDSQ